MSVYALSANGKESRKMIQDPRKNPDRHQKQLMGDHGSDFSLSEEFATHEIHVWL